MNENAGRDCLKIHNKFLKLGKDVYGGADKQKSLIQECIDYEKNWDISIGAENISFQCENDFELINSKLLLKEKKCVILGRTSSGKSTSINALLNEEVLPTSYGSTSNCFVEITASPTNRNYLVINDEERDIKELEDLNSLLSDGHLENGSHITMYYDKNQCQLLKDDVVIIDTPGYDSGIFDNNLMKGYFDDADIVVLVVSAQTGINGWDKTLVNNFKTTLAQLNFVILYNFWDVVHPKDRNGRVKVQSITRAKNILCDILNMDDTQADSSIFFVSASERIDIFTNKIAVNTTPFWNERNESFARFFEYLELKMSESLFTKKYNYLQKLKSILKSSLGQCQNCISQMNEKRFNLVENITNALENIDGLHGRVHQIISEIFNNSFESLLVEGLDLLEIDKSTTNQKYRELLEKFTEENLKYIKDKLRDFIKHENETISSFRETVFNEIYFPLYFNLKKELNSFDFEAFKDYLMKIRNVKRISTGVTIGLTGVTLAACAATGGVLLGVFAIAEAAFVTAGVVGGAIGAGAGGAIGGGAAYGGIKVPKFPFRFAWKNHEAAIRDLWNSFEIDLMNNYSTFMESMISNITEFITPIEEKATKIQDDLKNIAEELDDFQNYSLIY